MLNADQEAISHFPLNNEGARVNAHINRFLRPYQQEGIKFLFVVRIGWLDRSADSWSIGMDSIGKEREESWGTTWQESSPFSSLLC